MQVFGMKMQLYFFSTSFLYCIGEGIRTWKQGKAPLHTAAVSALHNKKTWNKNSIVTNINLILNKLTFYTDYFSLKSTR